MISQDSRTGKSGETGQKLDVCSEGVIRENGKVIEKSIHGLTTIEKKKPCARNLHREQDK